eukprot:1602607-Rhodomonas_salina.1
MCIASTLDASKLAPGWASSGLQCSPEAGASALGATRGRSEVSSEPPMCVASALDASKLAPG